LVKISRVAHISFWSIALAFFFCLSALRISRVAFKNSIHFMGPFHSTDSFFFFDTGRPNSSERLIELFGSIPASESVVIFTRSDERRSSFIGMMVAYLAWPHPVEIIDVIDRSPARADHHAETPGAYVFCRVNPPPSCRRGERFGETLEVVTAEKVAIK
jgi:hypothetical protein